MLFDPDISTKSYAVIRFGFGFPMRGTPVSAEGILARVNGPDAMGRLRPLLPFERTFQMGIDLRDGTRLKKRTGDEEPLKRARAALRQASSDVLVAELQRAVETDDPFRERLQAFWLNHFAARAKSLHFRPGHAGYAADAIRPHLTGHFADMLKAAVTHPFMLMYLDQQYSIGPNSPVGRCQKKGLNENLAREVLELHTVGVNGGYTQADVTEFAELLTGLHVSFRRGFTFLPDRAEPGAETVLGKSYGGKNAKLADIHAVLDDLALHPSTGAFLCRKLAAHFVADEPPVGLVQHMTAAYNGSDGHLGHVYAAMMDHPDAWRGFGAKVKTPMELVATALRAVGARSEHLAQLKPKQVNRGLVVPLRRMGQPYGNPPGPDGWPDHAAAWVSPYGVAARINFALGLAQRLPGGAPDPRSFVETALGDAAGKRLRFVARAAETRREGVGLILSSAEFNRR